VNKRAGLGTTVVKQKDIFLQGEGDAWFERNRAAIKQREFDQFHDPVVAAVQRCMSCVPVQQGKLLEVGCGEGGRLQWIEQNLGVECHGLDPSEKAVAAACGRGIHAIQGTAEQLPFNDHEFDFVVFGFCLYLCDRDDLFKIAQEAHRVLKPEAWLLIHDFFSRAPSSRMYHHRNGVNSYKMDYRSLFAWHPSYECFSHDVTHHGADLYTDDVNEWVGLSVMRKKSS
jgi:ubiquinone/menaquinone biosynthesis C-methylase UbiE